ncbi:hypothetical protein JVU11DRAFT_2405 [Chiua virens]|nr:hypothetical protein JVU11DRAFT_2405 [Chiua virens]
MAHGPCGPQFREAFSCFVYSEADPKGIDCVEKFKAMQDCFREHPDIYGEEIMDDDEEEPPAGLVTTEKLESSHELSDSDVLPLEATQQTATSASS